MQKLQLFIWIPKCKHNLIKYKYLSCNKEYLNKINEELNERFTNTFKFFNNELQI